MPSKKSFYKISLSLAFIFLTLSIIGSPHNPNHCFAAEEQFTDEKYGFSAMIPSGWTQEVTSSGGRIFKATLDPGNQRKSIIVHAYEAEASSGSLQEYRESLETGLDRNIQTLVESEEITVDQKSGYCFTIYEKRTFLNTTIYAVEKHIFIPNGGFLFDVRTRAAGPTRKESLQNYENYRYAFNEFLNSISIRPAPVVEKSANDVSAVGFGWQMPVRRLLFFIVLTWAMGLSVPLLIRFIFLRRPIEKWPALILVGFLWFLQYVFWIAVQSPNKSHLVLLIIAWVSYKILCKPNRENRQTFIPHPMDETDAIAASPVQQKQTANTKPVILGIGLVALFTLAAVFGPTMMIFVRSVIYGIKTTQNIKPVNWHPFHDPENRFSVLMPKPPARSITHANTKAGAMDIIVYSTDFQGKVFSIGYGDYPAGMVALQGTPSSLDGARNGAVANVRGKLLGEEIITLNGNAGREFKIEIPLPENKTATMTARVFLVGDRLYMLQVITPDSEVFSSDITKFFESFSLRVSLEKMGARNVVKK